MSKIRVAINGFGRIGRQVFRAIHATYRDQIEIVAINDLGDAATNLHLLEYDTTYGQAHINAQIDGNILTVGDWKITCVSECDPKNLPWGKLGADIIIESTGIFRSAKEAKIHTDNGAKKVIITAPAKDPDITIVLGVNHDEYDPKIHHIISNASCTTNCLAPIAFILEKHFGIQTGTMTTIHAYTNDQRILDLPHKDLRRARAAACNIIPTSTGAAQAVAEVIPSLKGKFTGWSLRVPTPTVSIVDFTALLKKGTNTDEMRQLFKEYASTSLKNILQFCEKPLVSMDFKGNSHSSIIDAEYTTVQDDTFAKVVAWYDNEWGYACRVVDLLLLLKERS